MRTNYQWSTSFILSFWSRVNNKDKVSECWPWTGSIVNEAKPYGRVRIEGRLKLTHRVAYELSRGELVPDDMQVLHSCDNCRCCNPTHLWVGTNADNMRDKSRKNRINPSGGPQGKFTFDEWQEIKKLHSEGWTNTEISNKFRCFDTTVRRVIEAGESYRYKGKDFSYAKLD
jgi:hypothetical protein